MTGRDLVKTILPASSRSRGGALTAIELTIVARETHFDNVAFYLPQTTLLACLGGSLSDGPLEIRIRYHGREIFGYPRLYGLVT